MDKLDIRIFREFFDLPAASPAQPDVRKSMRKVARNIGVSPTTIRERVARMRASGALRGWTPIFNPTCLGLEATILWFDSNTASKPGLIKKLLLLPGVNAVLNYYGSRVGMLLFFETPESLKRELELIERISEADNLAYSMVRFPPSPMKLTVTDFHILEGLAEKPEMSFIELGKKLGLSSRTIRRRIDRLTASFAAFAIPTFDPKKLEGAVVANMMVEYDRPEAKVQLDSRIRVRFNDSFVSSQMSIPDRGVFLFFVDNISKSREIHAWTSEQPGVKSSRVDIIEDAIQRFDWYRETLQRKFGVSEPRKRERVALVRPRVR